MKDGVGEWSVWVEVVMTDEVRGGQAGRVSLLCPYCVKPQTAASGE